MSQMRIKIWSRSLWSKRLLFAKCLRLTRLFWPKKSITPHPSERVEMQSHRCRSLGLGQKAIFICVIRLILLISRSAVLDYPGFWDFLGTLLATQGLPWAQGVLLTELALLRIWKRPFDRDLETGTDGIWIIDFFGQKCLVSLRHFANKSLLLQRLLDQILIRIWDILIQ